MLRRPPAYRAHLELDERWTYLAWRYSPRWKALACRLRLRRCDACRRWPNRLERNR